MSSRPAWTACETLKQTNTKTQTKTQTKPYYLLLPSLDTFP